MKNINISLPWPLVVVGIVLDIAMIITIIILLL